MESPNNRNLILALGAGLAVLAGVVIAVMLASRGQESSTPPAERGALTVDVKEAPTLDPSRRLRCYVNGQFVGESSLAECARKNGVSAQSLDVGLDESGALVAAETASLAPPPVLPPVVEAPPVEVIEDEPRPDDYADAGPAPVAQGPAGQCLRHAGGDWRELSTGLSLDACVRLLFDGQCVRPGDAVYGRWGDTTLRLVPGRVEQSNDNRTFRTLTTQGRGCTIR
ncbi:MAG TPA: hypothetical protein VEA15_02360 [Caulobacteraceae bacterium]|nr:hypothetical protein [Caulobacteraceae bacterium]